MVIEFRAKNKLLLPALAKASLSAILITGPAGNDDSSSIEGLYMLVVLRGATTKVLWYKVCRYVMVSLNFKMYYTCIPLERGNN